MAGGPVDETKAQAKSSLFQYARSWGEASYPPTVLATLITPLHLRPFQAVPMLFPPVLLFSSYLNLQGLKKDAAGVSAAWSAIYMLMASRRKHRVREKLSPRGIIRGATFTVATANVVGGGLYYMLAKREDEEEQT